MKRTSASYLATVPPKYTQICQTKNLPWEKCSREFLQASLCVPETRHCTDWMALWTLLCIHSRINLEDRSSHKKWKTIEGTSSKGSVSKACLFILKALGWGTTITIINCVPKSQIPPLRPFFPWWQLSKLSSLWEQSILEQDYSVPFILTCGVYLTPSQKSHWSTWQMLSWNEITINTSTDTTLLRKLSSLWPSILQWQDNYFL